MNMNVNTGFYFHLVSSAESENAHILFVFLFSFSSCVNTTTVAITSIKKWISTWHLQERRKSRRKKVEIMMRWRWWQSFSFYVLLVVLFGWLNFLSCIFLFLSGFFEGCCVCLTLFSGDTIAPKILPISLTCAAV